MPLLTLAKRIQQRRHSRHNLKPTNRKSEAFPHIERHSRRSYQSDHSRSLQGAKHSHLPFQFHQLRGFAAKLNKLDAYTSLLKSQIAISNVRLN
jgi:hypothetical protein